MRRIEKIGLGSLLIIGALGVASAMGPRYTNAPETYQGFDSYIRRGYQPVTCNIPTQGDVTNVIKIPGERYRETINPDGSITLEGLFDYKIEPDGRFSPDAPYHTDNHGKTPENPGDDYWGDEREGSVTLKRADR